MRAGGVVVALLCCGLLLRIHGWQFISQERKVAGFLLVAAGTLVTLSIVLVLTAAGGR